MTKGLDTPRVFLQRLSVNGKTSKKSIAKRHEVPCFSFKFYRLPIKTTQRLFWCLKTSRVSFECIYILLLRQVSSFIITCFGYKEQHRVASDRHSHFITSSVINGLKYTVNAFMITYFIFPVQFRGRRKSRVSTVV